MEQLVIEVEPRNPDGKGAARKLRSQGKIPGILYGHKEEPVPFALNPVVLRKQIRTSGMGRNTVFKVAGLKREALALLKDVQIDPVRRDIVHIDLLEVRESDQVTIEVPVDFQGKPVGVVNGGDLQLVRRAVRARCKPLEIPSSIPIDISELDIGDSLHVGDLVFPEGVELAEPKKMSLCSVKAPRVEEEKAVDEGVEGEVVEGEEGQEGEAKPAAEGEAAPEGKSDGKKGDGKKGDGKKGDGKKGDGKKSA